MDVIKDKLTKASQLINDADALFISAGKGMIIDSGLPDLTFNSAYWKTFTSIALPDKPMSELANPVTFENDPQIAWAYYGHCFNLYKRAKPHQGFIQLLEIAKKKQYGYFIFTSNEGGQFQKAGFDDAFIEESNGSIHHFQCSRPCSSDIWSARNEKVIVDLEIFEAREQLPECPHCGAIARPNILMSDDWTWLSHRSNEQGERLQRWLETVDSLGAKLVVIEIGAGHTIPTARLYSQRVSRSYRAPLIRINPIDYDVPEGGIGLPFGAKVGVGKLMEYLDF